MKFRTFCVMLVGSIIDAQKGKAAGISDIEVQIANFFSTKFLRKNNLGSDVRVRARDMSIKCNGFVASCDIEKNMSESLVLKATPIITVSGKNFSIRWFLTVYFNGDIVSSNEFDWIDEISSDAISERIRNQWQDMVSPVLLSQGLAPKEINSKIFSAFRRAA